MTQSHTGVIPSPVQKFEDSSGKPLASIKTHADVTSNSCYILWDEVENTFANILYLQNSATQRMFFEVDKEYNLIFPLRVIYSSIPYVPRVRAEEVDEQTQARKKINPRTWFNDANTTPSTHSLLESISDINTEVQEFRALHESLYELSEHEFLKAVAARNHYEHSLRAKIEAIRSVDSSLEQEVAKTLSGLALLHQKVLDLYEHHRLNKCQAIMENTNHCLEYPSPHLFLVLPSSLERWDDVDPSTHSFRLYFICDPRSSATTILPQHIHYSGHQGYEIDRPQEFFQQFGQYTLTLLSMIKHGYRRGPYTVPALDTFEILRCPGAPVRHTLTRDKIGPLVDKSIAHISKLSFKKSLWKITLNPQETRFLGSFLHLQGEECGFGGLHRVVERMPSGRMHWSCFDHAEHSRSSQLESTVTDLGGKVDRWLSVIAVSPVSVAQVVDIATALQGAKSVFDVTIRFKWIVSKDELQKLLSLMAHSGVANLQLDKLTSKARVHNFETEEDLFVNTIGSSTLLLVSLLNFPRPSEQYLYMGRAGSNIYGLQLNRTAELPFFDWFNMRIALERGLASITNRRTHTPYFEPNLKEVFRQVVFEKDLDVRGVDLFDPESKMWQGRLGVQDGVLIGLSDTIAPSTMLCQTLLEYGTLRALRLRTQDSVDIPNLCSLIEFNPGLQYLDIPAEEERIFRYLQPLWRRDATVTLQVVLREISAENTLCRIASLVLGARLSESSASIGRPVVDVLRWQCEYVSGLRADQDACVLDIATLNFPSVITSLTLNISTFTQVGLLSIQKALQRSPLERLVIHCSHFNPSLRKHVEQVLNNVQWPTIMSLTLIGDKIDDWISIWAKFGNLFGESPGLLGPRLSCLNIISTDSGKPISHFSALSLHRLIYSSKLVEVCLENIQLQDDGDWDLIIGAFDFATLKNLSVLNCLFIKMAPLVDQLKEQLSDLELIVFTLSPGEKHLTFISSLASSDNGEIQHHELDIKGIDVDQTSDIWHTLAPNSDGFQYGAVRAMCPDDLSSPRVLKSGTPYRALARPRNLSHLYRFYSLASCESGLQRIMLPTRTESFSNLHRRPQYTSLDMSVVGRRWSKNNSEMDSGICNSDGETSVGTSADMNSLSMTDNDAALLDTSSARHPSALTTLDLNIAHLTKQGLANLQSVLRRSTLEHLKISCQTISEALWDDVFQLLKSLRPATLKSLVLVGDNIDEWLWLWFKGNNHISLHGFMTDPSFLCPFLHKLEIRGDRRLQKLGPRSATMVCHLIRSSHLQELCLCHIQFAREDDWDLIAVTIERSGVATLVMSRELKAMMKQHFWFQFREKMVRDEALNSEFIMYNTMN